MRLGVPSLAPLGKSIVIRIESMMLLKVRFALPKTYSGSDVGARTDSL